MRDLFKVLRWKSFRTMVGRRAGVWLVLSMLSSLALAAVELMFAFFLAHLLFLLGISATDPNLGLPIPEFFLTRAGSLPFFIGLGLSRAAIRIFNTQSNIFFGELVHCRLRFIFFEVLYHRESPRVSQSDVNVRLGDIFPKATTFCSGLGAFGSAAAQATFFIIALFVKSPLKASIGCLAILVVAPVIRATHKFVRNMSFHIINDYESVQRSLVRASKNWMLIRVLRTENLELRRLHESSLATTQKSLRVHYISGLSSALPEFIGILLVALLLAAQYKLDPQPGAAFISFLYLFLRMVQALGAAGGTLGSLHSNFAGYIQAADLISGVKQRFIDRAMIPLRFLSLQGSTQGPQLETRTILVTANDSQKLEVNLECPPAIHIENLSYLYGRSETAVFKNLNLSVSAGSCLGIVGHSGAGKSTLLALLLGILEPTEGKLWLEVNSQTVSPREAQLPLGYVGAEPFLVAGSVSDNLLYGASNKFDRDQLIRALINAGFSEDAHDWDKFLKSPISEDGEGLSTGQKQRLCLARALLVHPKLLVLDEVSANLDLLAEEKIAEYVQRLSGRCTVIIVSHRPGMLKACDHLFDIQTREVRAQV